MTEEPTFAIFALLALLSAFALGICFVRGLLAASVLLGMASLIVAALYLALDAPDVAITEAAVGAGVSTVFFLAALLLTGEKESRTRVRILPLQLTLLLGALLGLAVSQLPAFGDPLAPSQTYLKPDYIARAGAETGIPNTVASILASYRGYDTLGETFVVFTAGIAVVMLIGERFFAPSGRERKKP